MLSPLRFHTGREPWRTRVSHLVVDSIAGARVVTRFVDMLVVGVLAFGVSFSFDFHVLVGAVIRVCVGGEVCDRSWCLRSQTTTTTHHFVQSSKSGGELNV
jgi:hypothetical protein